MGLDKFISGNTKRKKSRKTEQGDSKKKHKGKQKESTLESNDSNQVKPHQELKSESLVDPKIKNEIRLELNPDYEKLRNNVMKSFPGLTKDLLIDLLITEIHFSPTYSSNKTLVARLLEEKKNIQEISVLLQITYFETLILVNEIDLGKK